MTNDEQHTPDGDENTNDATDTGGESAEQLVIAEGTVDETTIANDDLAMTAEGAVSETTVETDGVVIAQVDEQFDDEPVTEKSTMAVASGQTHEHGSAGGAASYFGAASPPTQPTSPAAAQQPKQSTPTDSSSMGFWYFIIVAVIALGAMLPWILMQTAPAAPVADTINYNGFLFTKTSSGWETTWEREGELYKVPLRFTPFDVENVSMSGSLSPGFESRTIYVTFDPELTPLNFTALGAAEVSISLRQVFGLEIASACSKNVTDACRDRPIVHCGVQNVSVVQFEEGRVPRVVFEDNCIRIQGKGWDVLRATDRLLYGLYRIMP